MDGTTRQSLLDELGARLGDRVTTSAPILAQHAKDESWHAPHPPEIVVFPQSTDEVRAVVQACAARRVPMIPFGAGTSLEGGVAALAGGVTIDLTRMDAIVAVNAADLDATVEAGVKRKSLNAHLRDTGLFFPVDPGADATLGGMASTRASGTNAVRYGTMRENVIRLTVVLADGRVIRTGSRAKKSAAGYDLTRLFVGAEGTLGVITEVTLRLYGIPEAMSAAVSAFPSVEAAVDTCIQTVQSGIPVARVELLDALQMRAVNAYSKLDYAEAPTLFFEFHGSRRGVVEEAEAVQAIARDHGGADFRWGLAAEERNKLWQARHDAYYAALALRPGLKGWPTDVCVPLSRLADCIHETRADIEESGLVAPIVGHVGDGNFHLTLLLDPDDARDRARVAAFNGRLVARAQAMDGTCTGEHGVGYGKIDFLAGEHGDGLALMAALKRTFDPDNLMNPGKIVRPL
ncbi:MAG: FAD-binding protein [Alphaproteobacteria bacterium]|nr:FAD-binding protein [Alphaproteobacteria bacterium]